MQEPLLKKRINLTVSHFWKCCLFSVCMELWCGFFLGTGDVWQTVKAVFHRVWGVLVATEHYLTPSAGLQRGWNWGPQSAAVEGSTALQRDIWVPEAFLLWKQPNEPLFLKVEINNNKLWFLPKEGLVWKWGFLENGSPWLWGSAQLFMLIDKESLAHVIWCRGLALVSFVSQDIKSVIRDHLIMWGASVVGREPLNLSDPGSTVCQKTSSSTRKKLLQT